MSGAGGGGVRSISKNCKGVLKFVSGMEDCGELRLLTTIVDKLLQVYKRVTKFKQESTIMDNGLHVRTSVCWCRQMSKGVTGADKGRLVSPTI